MGIPGHFQNIHGPMPPGASRGRPVGDNPAIAIPVQGPRTAMTTEANSKQARLEAVRQRLDRLEGFLRDDPDNTLLLGDAFETALQCGQWDRAQAHLQHAQARNPGDATWALREGDFWLAQQHYPQARLVLERLALLAEPGTAFANVVAHNLAHIDLREAAYAACVSRLEPLMQAADRPGGQAAGGLTQQLWLQALHRLGELARACAWTLAAEQAGRLDAGAAGVAALAAIDEGDFDAAARWVRLAQAAPPGMELLVAQASLALAARDPAAARQFGAQALNINPLDGRAWSACGFADLLGGNLDAAAQDFRQALTYMPQHIGTWHGQGWTQLLRRDLAAARASFESALALDRNFAESHGGLAVVLALSQQAGPAREHIELAQRLERNNLSSRYAQAILSGEVQDTQAVQRLAHRLLGSRKAPLGGQMSDWLPPAPGPDKPQE